MKAAKRLIKEHDRIKAHHEAQRPAPVHVVLSEDEKRAMGIQTDHLTERKKARLLRIILIVFGIVALFVLFAQMAFFLP